MVYQINFELINSQQKFFEYLESIGNFVYLNKALYIDTNEHKSELLKNLKNIISDEEQIMIKSIDIDGNEFPLQIQYWIDNIKARQVQITLEENNKQNFNSMMKFLEDFEEELKKQKQQLQNIN